METLHNKQLHNLPVLNQDNKQVGVVVGFIIEADSQTIVQYEIAPRVMLGKGVGETRLVNKERVLSINAKCLIIDREDETTTERNTTTKLRYSLETPS